MLGLNKYYLVFVLLSFLTIKSNFLFATNYYISTTGNDGNAGTTSGTAKATLANVFSTFNLGTGDTVFVEAGTYTETGITVGTDDEAFVIQGAALSGGVPTSIFDAASTARWLLIGNTNNDNIVINRITIKDHKENDGGSPQGGGGIKIIDGATGTKINYCVFDNCDTKAASGHRGGAIYSAEDITITHTTFKNCNTYIYGGAISLELSIDNNSSISYCTFYNNNNDYWNDYGSAILFGPGTSVSLTITNSLFYKNGTSSTSGTCIAAMNAGATLNLMNCTITANGNTSNGTGGVIALSSAHINATNTIFYNNVGNTYNDAYNNTSTFSMVNCCYGSSSEINSISPTTSCLIANPLFTNSATDDYTLQSSSTLVDAGTTSGAPSDDILSYTRTAVPDIGAFEYGGAAPLGVSLTKFQGIPESRSNKLFWQTRSEENNDFFTLEKSTDGYNFSEIGTEFGCGNCNNLNDYSIYDYLVEPTINYYRLKQTDFNGRYTYSKIISIDNRDLNNHEIIGVFNLLGQPVDLTQKGLILIKYKDGTSKKIVNE
jgi:hypothetical protein